MKTAIATTARLRGLAVTFWLHTRDDPSPDEWEKGLAQMLEMKRGVGNELHRIRNLVISDGGAPSAPQRKQLHQVIYNNIPSKLAVITPLYSPLKRGIATALGWLNPSFKAVPAEQWRDALMHVDLDLELDAVLSILLNLQKNFPPVETLAEFAQHARGAAQRFA
jgi:hypothetical protein